MEFLSKKLMSKLSNISKDELIAQLEEIIALMPGHVYWLDKNNVFLGCNDQQAKDAGLKSRHEIVGKTNSDLLWSAEADKLNEINNYVMETGETYTVEETAEMLDGKGVYLSQKVPLRSNTGEINGVLGISFDITDRKKAEQELREAKERAEAANEAKMRFLATMSHELRTPLNGIVGLGDLLRQTKLTKKQKDFVDRIVDSGCYLSALVSDILMFAKLDAGKLELNAKPFDLKYVVEGVVKDLSHVVEDISNLTLKFKTQNDIAPQMMGDDVRIRQIVVNLVNNAIKFTKQGSITVELTALAKKHDVQQFEIKIQDTGRGIAPDKIDKIFDRFYQAEKEDAHVQSTRGLGLGLAIVKDLVELMGGTIEVTSEVDKGTTFRLVIPFKLIGESRHNLERPSTVLEVQSIQHSQKTRKTSSRKSKKRALLVEDEPLNQLVAVNILKQLGFHVDLAITGKMAMEQMLEKKYTVIFMDMQLPDTTGAQVAQWLRCESNNSNNSQTPVIAITGHALPEEVNAFKDAGVIEILVKPIMIAQVEEALAKANLQ